MSHNINIINEKASMFYHGEVPWHGLGQSLDRPATAEEAIKLAGLDFTVEKRKMFIINPANSSLIEVPNKFATVRTDTDDILGTVGNVYEILQNNEAFKFFDPIVDKEEAIYHTAGVLGKGEKIWILAKLPDYIRVQDEVIEKYLLLTNTHDGSKKVTAKFTPVRVVCNNTLTCALRGNELEIGIKHSSSMIENLQEGYKTLGIVNKLSQELETIFNKMTLVNMNNEKRTEYISKVFPVNDKSTRKNRTLNIHNKIYELVETGKGSELVTAKGTLWGAYNAITEYADHVKVADYEKDERAESIWFGSSNSLKNKAFEEALKFLN